MIVHPDLGSGGAERQIVQLCNRVDKRKINVILVLYHNSGLFLDLLEKSKDVNVITLHAPKSFLGMNRIVSLVKIIKKHKPSIVYSYLENVNVVTGICRFFIKNTKIVWGIRVSKYSSSTRSFKDVVIHKLACMLSRKADLVIANNRRGLIQFQEVGYVLRSSEVILNGIDSEWFKFRKDLRTVLRDQLNITNDTIVIGQMARVVKEKGHETLIKAVSLLKRKYNIQNIVILFIGRGREALIEELTELHKSLNPETKLLWLGQRSDSKTILSACDIVTLASHEGDGFPNVIGEALSLERPVVVTDVGDCREIFGGTAFVVEPKNPEAIADAWFDIIQNPSKAAKYSKAGRRLIKEHYSVKRSAERTENALLELFTNKTRIIE